MGFAVSNSQVERPWAASFHASPSSLDFAFHAWVRDRKTKDYLLSLLSRLNEEELDSFLCKVAHYHLEHPEVKILDDALGLLTLDQLCMLTCFKNQQVENTLDELQKLATEVAKMERKGETQQIKREAAQAISFLHRFFQSFIELFMKAHDFSMDDPPPQTRWEANWRLDAFYQLIQKPLVLISWIINTLASVSPFAWLPYLVAGLTVLLGALGLKAYRVWFDSTPSSLSNDFRNLTLQAKSGQLEPVVGRQREVVELIKMIGNINDPCVVVPLLIGKTGVGKSDIVKGLAQKIADGDIPELQGVQVYLIPTATLHNFGGGSGVSYATRLEMLLKEIQGCENRVLLFFDEIHDLVSSKGQFNVSRLDQEFKTLYDSGKVHIIGATTKDEYEKTILKDGALNRRFLPIEVQELDNETCTTLLDNYVRTKHPDVKISHEAIVKALNLTNNILPEQAQPSKAKKLLEITMTSIQFYHGKESIEIEKLEKELQLVRLNYQTLGNCSLSNEPAKQLLDQAQELGEQIGDLRAKELVNKNLLSELRKMRKESLNWNNRYVFLAKELISSKPSVKQKETLSKQWLFTGYYYLRALEELISNKEDEVQVKMIQTQVDEQVVKQVFRRYHTS